MLALFELTRLKPLSLVGENTENIFEAKIFENYKLYRHNYQKKILIKSIIRRNVAYMSKESENEMEKY